MKTFLGMQVEQSRKRIRLHLDNYVQELLDEYKACATKSLRTKQTPCQPGLILTQEDCPILLDAERQKYYSSFVAKLQFAASWVRFEISFAMAQLARFCASAAVSRSVAFGGSTPPDGISCGIFELQADLSQAVCAQQWPFWLL